MSDVHSVNPNNELPAERPATTAQGFDGEAFDGQLDAQRKRNSVDNFNADKKRIFLEMYAKSPNLSGIAKELGLHPSTVYLHMKGDSAFAAAMQRCREEITDRLEARVAEYAERPTHFLDRIAWLKAHRPERWNPETKLSVSHNVEVTGKLLDATKSYETEIVSTQDE